MIITTLTLTQPSRNELLETARYLDGHEDATAYELAILERQQAAEMERLHARQLTMRIGMGAGALVSIAWAAAWAYVRSKQSRLPPAPAPRVISGYDYRRLEEWGD